MDSLTQADVLIYTETHPMTSVEITKPPPSCVVRTSQTYIHTHGYLLFQINDAIGHIWAQFHAGQNVTSILIFSVTLPGC